MLSPARPTPAPDTDPAPTWSPVEWFLQRYWLPFSRRWPIGALFVVIVISNVAGTVFNFVYNIQLIVAQYMDEAQKDAFWATANVYNSIAWPICLGLVYVLLLPVVRALREMRRGREPSPGRMEVCRQRLVNFTLIQMGINALGWVPGAIVFPLSIISLAGEHMAEEIWQHFAISFTVSALLTTVQTFFLCESYLIAVLYPAFFKDARPAQVQGAWRVPFSARLTIMWMAVALMPLIALLVVAQNFEEDRDHVALRRLATVVTLVGVGSGGIISYLVGRQLHRWIKAQAAATEQIALGRFDVRVPQKRPDEWGRLTDDFNDMAAALGRAQVMRETFGQIVGPRVRDSILERYQGVGGEVRDITVLFADIRGFTQRSAGESPDRVFALLNRVLTLAVAAVE